MKNTALRTKSIGTKVTEEEFARLEELAPRGGSDESRMGAVAAARIVREPQHHFDATMASSVMYLPAGRDE